MQSVCLAQSWQPVASCWSVSYGTRSRNIFKRAAFAALFVVAGIANFNRTVLAISAKIIHDRGDRYFPGISKERGVLILYRYVITGVAAGALCIVSVWGALMAIGQVGVPGKTPTEPLTDPDAALTEGTSSWRGLELTQSLTAEHGGTVNFWIRNEGFDPVEITIDRTGARVIEPGAEGHISAEVRWEKTDYLFEAKPAGETGSVEVDYKIAQRA